MSVAPHGPFLQLALVADDVFIRLEDFPYRWTIYMPLAVYCTMHLSIMTMLHPNQYVYYNAFAGGVEGAQRKFNLDYWANSYAEAAQGLEDYLRAQYGLGFVEREFTVAVCGPAEYYFPENFSFTEEENPSTRSNVWARCSRSCLIAATFSRFSGAQTIRLESIADRAFRFIGYGGWRGHRPTHRISAGPELAPVLHW
jgi:hypothetical protein